MTAQEPIPVFNNLKDLYVNLVNSVDHAARWNNPTKELENPFGKKPSYIARAPGRVNIIGEHIDYALFGVLPAAIEKDILVACAPHHVFASFSQGWYLEIPPELRWENYIKVAYYGVVEQNFAGTTLQPIPVDLLVTGSVQKLAFNRKLKGTEQGELVKLAMEKRVGVHSGGMDQAASFMSVPSSVLYITFYPFLTASSTPLPGTYLLSLTFPLTDSPPGGAVLVCAHSLKVSDKALTAKRGYNLRVVETLVRRLRLRGRTGTSRC
ncbi:ribosomal protein S5 domain 2-type protein [Mycena capillaripes]|nr:ribosomal protein S5 domain 2-type protein [Mycena capillaripes]